jgi:squalene-hopene/tetraprenyl-beta-curcumene cyclase
MALHLVDSQKHCQLITGGLRWLADHQNPDGGWGDTVKSLSNISTTMLCRAALELASGGRESREAITKVEAYLVKHAGSAPAERAEAIRRRYGKDRTFSVPILMSCALAGLVPWREVPRLPFELACLPQSWYRFARLPVVSYALPALIAIGQCVHHHRTSWNPVRNVVRRLARSLSLKVLRRIQPTSGGYLEATPLTSFVVMALATSSQRQQGPAAAVIDASVHFLVNSVRPDGSWPIDTNLATWVTTLSVNALAAAGDLESLDSKKAILDWLVKQQYTVRHPYTGADPGGWAWTDLPGGVPDCDDTPGAVLALAHLNADSVVVANAFRWLDGLQNSDHGMPTFCRGWGTLPFDRSGSDLTAHTLKALALWYDTDRPPDSIIQIEQGLERLYDGGLAYLSRHQRADGSWLPLWFGNQHAPDENNPVYGTSRVLAAYRDLDMKTAAECQRGVNYLLSVQNADGGWGGAQDCPSSVEETALAVEVLIDLVTETPPADAGGSPVERGLTWLVEAVETGRFRESSPIGFYFAKLWYFEKLYPLIFTVAALGRAVRSR